MKRPRGAATAPSFRAPSEGPAEVIATSATVTFERDEIILLNIAVAMFAAARFTESADESADLTARLEAALLFAVITGKIGDETVLHLTDKVKAALLATGE